MSIKCNHFKHVSKQCQLFFYSLSRHLNTHQLLLLLSRGSAPPSTVCRRAPCSLPAGGTAAAPGAAPIAVGPGLGDGPVFR